MQTHPKPLTTRMLLVALLATVIIGTDGAAGENWPQWRGPKNNGVAPGPAAPTKWSDTVNVLWNTPLPGSGGSTPVVWEDTIFLSSASGDDLVLLSLDRKSGKQNWSVKVTDENQTARRTEGNSASASPCTDGEHVWVFFCRGEGFRSGILACYDFSGQEVWKIDIADRFGTIDIQFGLSSTPVLHEDALYLQIIHGAMVRDNDSRTGKVVKLDKRTGETLWEVERPTNAVFENKHSYASPFLYDDGQRKFLVAHGADCTTGHDLATGEEIWRFSNLNGPTTINPGKFDYTFRFVASPCVADGLIVIPTCKRGPMVALKVDANLKGDINQESDNIAWVHPTTPDVSIPLVTRDIVYALDARGGIFSALDRRSGEKLYEERTHSQAHRSSPVLAGEHIYFIARDATCSVVKAGREFELVATNSFADDEATSSPVIIDGVIYLRTFKHLYAIGR